jgi:hypothetical protein
MLDDPEDEGRIVSDTEERLIKVYFELCDDHRYHQEKMYVISALSRSR